MPPDAIAIINSPTKIPRDVDDVSLSALKIERQIELIDQIQRNGHLVTDGRELRQQLTQLLERLHAHTPN